MDTRNYDHFFSEYLWKKANVVLLIVDAAGFIVKANNFACEITGNSLIGFQLEKIFTESNANIQKLLLGDEVSKLMLNVNLATGLPQTFYFSSFKNGRNTLLFAELDFYEIEEMRKNMVYINNDLNNITRELHKKNAQLAQLDKLKNEFLGVAAHDLRNPIGNIMLCSEHVLETEGDRLSQDGRELIELTNSTSHYMLELINQLLDVVKIESGKLELHPELTDVNQFLISAVRFNAIFANHKDIQIKLEVVDHLPLVMLDKDKITQVINNLITNAVKFSEKGTVITVSATQTDQEVLIAVQDQGQGIPESEIPLLFKPFSKVSVKSTAGEKSTGLGLSIVKSIINHHQGRIWVESQQGKGSVFYFTIPIHKTPKHE